MSPGANLAFARRSTQRPTTAPQPLKGSLLNPNMAPSNSDSERYDAIVVGAGAAGLLAAARSAERGRRTIVLEKNRKAGVKILMSGGTRCNITHDCEADGIISAFGSAGRFLHSPLAALSPHDLVEMFHAEGLPTKSEPGGKIFPQSDRAADVLEALLRRLRRSGAELATSEAVIQLDRSGEGFLVSTANRRLVATKLLITTGGKSYPGCGTTGDGYRWLVEWGHTIHRPRPALVPLTSDEAWLHELSGVTVADVRLYVVNPNSGAEPLKPQSKRRHGNGPPGALMDRRGSMLFTHFGLSGPAVLDVSRAITGARDPHDVLLLADFLPDIPTDTLTEQIRRYAVAEGRKTALSVAADHLPRRLATALLERAAVPADRRTAEISNEERGRLVAQLKRCDIRVSGSRGFDNAEVTAGGVSLDEVDSRTMQSRVVPNLFLAGEILDLDGFIGGYNFQAAFSTGFLAGANL